MSKVKEEENNKKMQFKRAGDSVNLKMGIVGLPNVGKSTLFNKLTNNSVPAENYPFCTIEPSVGHLKINDPRIKFLEKIYKPKKTVNACLTVIDIAGLVKGASEGEGLGNQFLDHIRNVDGIFMVVRCFEDKEVGHVENSIDPLRDIQIIKDELRIKDKENMIKIIVKAEKDVRIKPGDKKMMKRLETANKLKEILETKWINEELYDNDEIEFINTLNLLTTKNIVILANISSKHYESRKCNKHLKSVIDIYGKDVIPFSAIYSNDKNKISNEEESEILSEQFDEEFLNKLVKKGYESLNLINFSTVGQDEVKSWTIREGMKAPSAGAVIHTDFEKNFICAEVMGYDDFVNNPNESTMRSIGKYRQEGKNYVVKDGDIIYFKVGTSGSGSKK